MTTSQPRQPKGQPVGGQFAVKRQTDDDVLGLTHPERNPSFNDNVLLKQGDPTPWGEAHGVENIATGLAFVSAAGHGGYKLSGERNRGISAALRNANGWYEEDCERHIVEMFFTRDVASDADDLDAWHERAVQGVKDYFPDRYEKATGITLAEGESRAKDQQTWEATHREDFVGRVAWGSGTGVEDFIVPEGSVLVSARRESDGVENHYLVPTEEYRFRDPSQGFLVDPERHSPVNQINDARIERRQSEITATTRYTSVVSPRSEAGQRRLDKEMDKLWRDGDTQEVYSMRDRIESGAYVGKSVGVSRGKREYYLELAAEDGGPGSYLTPVSKTLWEAFSAPDTRTEKDKARQDYLIASDTFEKIRTDRWSDKQREAAAKLKTAREKWEAFE